jgi:hypothetical protein
VPRPRPILVTGVPRSGTTWLARLLATAPKASLAGREPMNPRGRQYALGHTLPGWVHLETFDARQKRLIRSAYHGTNPMVYSRYGRHQWTAVLPWRRLIMKDPFAMLSLRAVADATQPDIVFLYRHPGAVLTSYRRMGWQPDLEELQPIIQAHPAYSNDGDLSLQDLPASGETSEAEAMGRFWAALHIMALYDITTLPDVVVVSHEELATHGQDAAARLFNRLRLAMTTDTDDELAQETRGSSASSSSSGLHNFDRSPADAATAWRHKLEPTEVEEIETVTAPVHRALERIRFRLCDTLGRGEPTSGPE